MSNAEQKDFARLQEFNAALQAKCDRYDEELRKLSDSLANVMEREGLAPSECTLTDFATALNNYAARVDRLEERCKRLIDMRDESIADAHEELVHKLKDAEAHYDGLLTRYNSLAGDAAKAARAYSEEIEQHKADLLAVRNQLADSIQASLSVLKTFLQRPHRLMEIFGPDVYQAAKDTYVSLGGDGSALVAPEINRLQETHVLNGEEHGNIQGT